MVYTKVTVEGMNSPSCEASIKKALLQLDGVEAVTTSLKDNTASALHKGGVLYRHVKNAVNDAGFVVV